LPGRARLTTHARVSLVNCVRVNRGSRRGVSVKRAARGWTETTGALCIQQAHHSSSPLPRFTRTLYAAARTTTPIYWSVTVPLHRSARNHFRPSRNAYTPPRPNARKMSTPKTRAGTKHSKNNPYGPRRRLYALLLSPSIKLILRFPPRKYINMYRIIRHAPTTVALPVPDRHIWQFVSPGNIFPKINEQPKNEGACQYVYAHVNSLQRRFIRR